MKQCKCEHWQQCPICMPHRFDAEGNVLPPEPTPLQAALAQLAIESRIVQDQMGTIHELQVELAECRKDAIRYRWLRDKTTKQWLQNDLVNSYNWDADVSAAMEAKP